MNIENIDKHNDKTILLYDGECSFCNGAVQWIIPRDPHAHIHFAAQQGEVGVLLTQHYSIPKDIDSLILIDKGKAYLYSAAVLRASKYLHRAWPLVQLLLIVPGFIRNPLYRAFAKNRYRWFGKQQSCLLPTPQIRARYLD